MAQTHDHGNMDIEEHQKTFEAFITWLIRIGVICAAVLIFLALFNS